MAELATNPPTLDGDYPLTQAQIDSFRANGFAYLPNVCSRRRSRTIAGDRTRDVRAQRREASAGRTRCVQEARAADHADPLPRSGGDGVRDGAPLRQDRRRTARCEWRADLSRPVAVQRAGRWRGENITPWHQDLYYWPFNEGTVCGMWMPLQDITAQMGNMRFVKGSHKHGYLGEHHISDESQAAYDNGLRTTRRDRRRGADARG